MMPSLIFLFVTFLAIGHCSTIPELPKSDPSSAVPEVPTSTGLPGSTRGPHTHEEHPANDPDHSDHVHVDEPKATKTDEEDHEHPGHDHSAETGHDHKLDHPEEPKKEDDTKPKPSEEAPKKDEVKDDQEAGEKRSKRGLWRRRLD